MTAAGPPAGAFSHKDAVEAWHRLMYRVVTVGNWYLLQVRAWGMFLGWVGVGTACGLVHLVSISAGRCVPAAGVLHCSGSPKPWTACISPGPACLCVAELQFCACCACCADPLGTLRLRCMLCPAAGPGGAHCAVGHRGGGHPL